MTTLKADQTRAPRPIAHLFLAALAVMSAGQAWALKDDAKQPILIEADDVEVRESDNTSVYVGNVQVDQGSMQLLADHVTVYHREDRQPKFIIALGKPARYKQRLDGDQSEVHAFAKRIEYNADKDELVLIGDGVLIQGEDRLTSERIIYDRAHAQFRAGGSGRVKITITPEKQ
ncbi:lipopolysaccharide transport periplasmic protein LptA [Thiorhodococcus fuscus]|uniref:Lipopolysaccharide export system protein LptA n=1 Tax=Thiorhodococcus fuscus TaxID=527200 RepID=A0ABW4Y5P7_9GAMM